jgi:hypothetical protein
VRNLEFWNSVPPGQSGARRTVIEGWLMDLTAGIKPFVDNLKAGKLALAPYLSNSFATQIEVILGDFLGLAGMINRPADGLENHGIRVEVFSTDPVSETDFNMIADEHWPSPEPAPSPPPAVFYQSEWAVKPTALVAKLLESLHIDADLWNWWQDVALHLSLDPMIPPAARLPLDGKVWHYRLHDFMAWLNRITWGSEWLKYQKGGSAPPAPRPRRVS